MADMSTPERGAMYLQEVAKSDYGAKALSFLLTNMNLFATNHSGNAQSDAYYNGRRSVALDIKELLGDELFFKVVTTRY